MAVGKENDKLYALMNQQPAVISPQAEEQAAQLRAVEEAAQNVDYSRTADARLDRAINEVLRGSGFTYDTGNDESYQQFAKEYSQNALSGREAAETTARQLAGGWTPTYAPAVGSEVTHDIVSNIANYTPAIRAAAQREAAARTAQAGNVAQIYNAIADTGYQRGRDEQDDKMKFINYLANRYNTERQAEQQQTALAGDVYRAKLSGAMQNAADARSIDNSRYQFDDQSAQSRAQLAAQAYKNSREMEYDRAKDEYTERIAAQKAAEQQAAAQQAADAKAAKQLEKDKRTYAIATNKISDYITSQKTPNATDRYDLDFNKDGKVDSKDEVIAAQAAKTGQLRFTAEKTDKTDKVEQLVMSGQITKNKLKKYIEDADLSIPESIYLYQMYGLT